MQYYSTNKISPSVGFRLATIHGQAPDKGLYFPQKIPAIEKKWLNKLSEYKDEDICFKVIHPYVAESIPDEILFNIVSETIRFPIPLVPVDDCSYALELFHGPTLAFKDVGARFMSRCLGYFVKGQKEKITVLVATSGDTGGAVANGFYEVEGVEVVILYPSGKVSSVQEKQLTTVGKNIHALEVQGSFDDCQQMVKRAFADRSLKNKRFLTSANSINVARWLPQQFYYFLAWKQWQEKDKPPVISVPSGNFGNICAGLLAKQSGLPVDHFVAACNANDVIPRYMQTQELTPHKAIHTISNAMDVGEPSNFIRILEMFRHYFPELQKNFSASSFSDDETRSTIRKVYKKHKYVLDPHGAIGYLALQQHLVECPEKKGIFLETAHPVKFPESVSEQTGREPEIPESVRLIIDRKKQSTVIKALYPSLKEYLLR